MRGVARTPALVYVTALITHHARARGPFAVCIVRTMHAHVARAVRVSLVARAVLYRTLRRRVCARHSDAHLSIYLTQHSGTSCPLPSAYRMQSVRAMCAHGAGRSKCAQCVDCAVPCVRLPRLCSVCMYVSCTDLMDPKRIQSPAHAAMRCEGE
jgi:hypothetical protein